MAKKDFSLGEKYVCFYRGVLKDFWNIVPERVEDIIQEDSEGLLNSVGDVLYSLSRIPIEESRIFSNSQRKKITTFAEEFGEYFNLVSQSIRYREKIEAVSKSIETQRKAINSLLEE